MGASLIAGPFAFKKNCAKAWSKATVGKANAGGWFASRGCAVLRETLRGRKIVKLVLFQTSSDAEARPGVLTERGVVDISVAVRKSYTPQLVMQGIIDDFDMLRSTLEKFARDEKALALAGLRLRAPLPRPGKILACIANYWEHAQREARPLNMFMKNPDAVIGPGDTIMLPEYTVPWMFMHEAELALVMKGPSKMVKAGDWRSAVFGYTAMIDVSAREQGRRTWPATPLTSWLGKSFDTFAPIGPCIATADEIPDPNDLIVRFWNDGQLRHNYNTDDMEHRVPELVEFATTVMTMNSGDLIACGTNHEGLGALQDGETVEIEVQHIGKMSLKVADPLKRTWERGVYMGQDSTHPDAVKRHRPRCGGG
jgi:2-keto-4-pentenoate hydratase/2-oxohepta-3-ene-1,7-dioic acid hydratase in catechol pathway